MQTSWTGEGTDQSTTTSGESNLRQLLPTWRQVSKKATDESPQSRAGHSLVSFSNRLFLFGGFSNLNGSQLDEPGSVAMLASSGMPAYMFFNSVYEFDCVSGEWTQLMAHEEKETHPAPRRLATMVVHGGSLYIFGGFDKEGHVLGDMWEFRIVERQWKPVRWQAYSTDSDLRQVPTARAEHTAVIFRNQMIVFGGYDGKKKLNDTYVFDLKTRKWSRPPEAETNAPSRRCKHAAVMFGKKMYVLGGFQFIHGENFAQTDMYTLDCEDFVWSPVLMRGQIPGALQGHKAVVCEKSMYIIGGKFRPDAVNGSDGRSSELNQELWQFRFDINVWLTVAYFGSAPRARHLHAAVAVPGCDWRWSIYVYGGTDREKDICYDDMHQLESLHFPQHSSNENCVLCNDIKSLVNNKNFADIVFEVEGKPIYAHKCILAARSKYFRNMFKSNMREERENRVVIHEVPYAVFLALLEFTYTDRVELDGEVSIDVLKAANQFGFDGLRAQCEENFSRAITVQNAAALCEMADQHDAENLRNYCILFIVQNFGEVMETAGFKEIMCREKCFRLIKDILYKAVCEARTVHENSRKRKRDPAFA